ncbi:hypothetical protein BFW87_10880 [Pseudomonas fluorescens]|uniref:Thiaminase-2/PQQC domain-containing protein n=1 Tax=Pseudomonas fluorescens TaxID=294 RepID=A0A1T2YXN4_PSEFL|nr:iron-containing redox enzyme family protein [Pseudomonas fluorescens]OPA96818.1 hypothetical protein BFW87_10880 [Pseudomonas fluorescens]
MQTSIKRFNYPKLRHGVVYTQIANEHHLDYRKQSIVLEQDDTASLNRVIQDLQQGTLTTEAFYTKHAADYPDDQLEVLIADLDKNYLLTEGQYPQIQGVLSGVEFAKKLKLLTSALHGKIGNSTLYEKMRDGSATRSQLIGFAIEYYHIVKSAPKVISPALAHNSPADVYQGIKQLFLEEHDHESLLANALSHVGVERAQLAMTSPLDTTFAIYSTLGVYARQHIISFISALFLFEEPYPEFNKLFVESCSRLELPEAFWKPIIGHSDVNSDADHGAITDSLLVHYSAISEEECRVTLIHICALLELMAAWDKQICTHYGSDVTLRLFN